MTKRQIIDDIIESNPTAAPAFLAQFDHVDLLDYLRHLQVLKAPRLTANTGRYERHFPPPAPPAADELSVLSPLPRAAIRECPAAAASPTSASVVTQEATSLAWADLDLDFNENSPSDPRADTMEFEPIVIAEPADDEPAPAPQHEPAEQTVIAADDNGDRITYESDHLVATHTERDGFDNDQESWLF